MNPGASTKARLRNQTHMSLLNAPSNKAANEALQDLFLSLRTSGATPRSAEHDETTSLPCGSRGQAVLCRRPTLPPPHRPMHRSWHSESHNWEAREGSGGQRRLPIILQGVGRLCSQEARALASPLDSVAARAGAPARRFWCIAALSPWRAIVLAYEFVPKIGCLAPCPGPRLSDASRAAAPRGPGARPPWLSPKQCKKLAARRRTFCRSSCGVSLSSTTSPWVKFSQSPCLQ